MKVVIATNDKKSLNGHFALCNYFMLFEVSESSFSLVNEVCFSKELFYDEEKLKHTNKKPFGVEERFEAIKGYDVVFVSAIGGPIADRVIEAKVYPIEMNAPESIDIVISKLQTMLKGKQPLWLQKVLKHEFY